MLKKLMILPIVAGFLAVNAGAQEAGAEEVVVPTNNDGCYEISSAEQLLAFSDMINYGVASKTSCAVLMDDIKFNGDTKVVKNDLSGLAVGDVKTLNVWSPMVEFAGSFDGQGHTIFGLYYTASYDAGLFASLSGYAKVKNVHIEDSYFAADERVGGLAADLKTGSHVDIDRVSFKGIVTVVKSCRQAYTAVRLEHVNGHMGGLIGTVSVGAEIINLSNSYNEGTVTAGNCDVYNDALGGLVGSVQDKDKTLEVNITNCYNTGDVHQGGLNAASPSIIGTKNGNPTIVANNVGCTSSQAAYCTTTNSDPSILAAAYESNIEAQIQAALSNPENPAEGVEVGKDSETGKRVAYLKLTDSDNQVIIPQDILVDSIVLDRSFSTNRSTITLPFSISVDKVKDSQGQPVDFYTLDAMTVTDENKWEVEATKLSVGAINAHTPYLVQAKNEGPITFDGSVTLKAANGEARFSSISYAAGDWSFNGVYTKKTWVDDERAQEGCEECGRSYIFSNNKFMKVGKSGGVLPYRAYLMAPVPFRPALAKAAAGATVENPSEIAIRVLGTDENKYSTYDVVFQKAEPIEIIESIDDPEGESQSLRQPVMMPAKRSSNKWADVKGRSMNRKPTAKGVYINNEIPVIVK